MRNAGVNVVAAVLYCILSIILTYPLAVHMNDSVPGVYDVWSHLWNLWWVRTSILRLHETPLHTQYLFHPQGEDLALHEMAMVDGLMALPFGNIVFAYNILCLLSFALSGLGMYLLAFYVIGDRKSAFFSGLVYAFVPYHFFEVTAGHLNLLTIQWVPFYVLYLLKTVKETSRWNPICCAFFLVLVSLSTWQYALYALLFTLLYLFHLHINEKNRLTAGWHGIKTMALCYLLLISPFLASALVSIASHDFTIRKSFYSLASYSSDALSVFMPNPYHPIFGAYSQRIYNAFGGTIYQAAASIGYTTLLLIAYYIAKKEHIQGWIRGKLALVRYTPRVKKFIIFIVILYTAFLYTAFQFDATAWLVYSGLMASVIASYYMVKEGKIGFWLLSALAFWILSMGPMLQFMGRMYFPLPYLLLMAIPLIRAPYRAAVFFNLSAALLAGMGLSELNKRFDRGVVFTLLVSSLVLFEFLSVPVFLSDTSVPEFYQTLREEQGDFALLEVQVSPLTVLVYDSEKNVSYYITYDISEYMYYQTVHEKSIMGGGIATTMYSDLTDLLDNTPVLHQLRNPGSQDILMQNTSEIANEVLSYYNIRYVIVHNNTIHILDEFQENASGVIQHTLDGFFPDNEVVYNDSTMYAIRVKNEKIPMFMRLGRGWYMPSNGSRWMKDKADLIVESTVEAETEVCFKAKAAVKSPLEVGGMIFNLNESFSYNTLRINLKPGENKITFKSMDGCLKEPCISFKFTEIQLGPCKTKEHGPAG
jgi:hypothetical protein